MRLAALALLCLTAASTASAQDAGGMNAHGFILSAQDGDIRDHYTVHRPGDLNAGEWFAGGVLEYANRPLVRVTERSGGDDIVDAALNHVMGLNLAGGYTPIDRLRLTASMPLYLTSTGIDGPQGAGVGDIRLDAQVLILRPDDQDGIGIGVVPWLDLPTGDTEKFLGRRAVAGGLAAVGTYELDSWTLSGNLGVQLDPAVDELANLTGSDSLVAALGVNRLLDERSTLGLEAHLLAPFSKNDRAGTGSPAETILSYRRTTEVGGYFTGGLALPLSPGAGAAAFRLMIGGGFGKVGPAAPKDRDLDGITDDLDACIDQPETKNGYIDEDGCPDELATLTAKVTFNGEPLDGAQIVIAGPGGEERARSSITSPWMREVPPDTMWRLTATQGECLEGETKKLVDTGAHEADIQMHLVASATLRLSVHDASGSPIPTARIVWESQSPECLPEPPLLGADGQSVSDIGPGRHKVIVGAPGYRVVEVPFTAARGDDIPLDITLSPTKLRVEKKRIVILDKVQFEFNRSVIKDVSFDLLNEVAEVIMRNPQAGRVEVQGHTDDKGSDKYNLELSQKRADAVRKYLIDRGVQKDRLIAKGYGESVAIADNGTEEGRALNRRVEFLLIDQAGQEIQEPAP